MPESTDASLPESGPEVINPTPSNVDTKPPVKEATQSPESKKSVDLLIVLGQGPVKPLLREQDLDSQMKQRWEAFKADPLHNTEPDFRVLEGDTYLNQLKGLEESQIQANLSEWQKLGRFGLNRWGRQNALSGGYALLSGWTDRVLLSGGKTIPAWAKEKLPPERLADWPSEAQLMADIIRRRFGTTYQEIYGKPIDSVIIIEDRSTNTLENFANSINSDQGQDILNGMKNTGVLAANFHVPRGEDIAYLFAPGGNFEQGSSAQQVLSTRIEGRNKQTYERILNWMSDPRNQDLRAREGMEKVWTGALNDPELLTYWLGYIGVVEDPRVLQSTVQRLNSDPTWRSQAVNAFNKVGLDFNTLASTELTKMDLTQFRQIADKLKILSTKEYRAMPEIPKN